MATLPATQASIDAFRGEIESLLAAGRHADAVELVVTLLSTLKQENDRLGVRLARLLADKFGRRSEKIPSAQLGLFLEQVLASAQATPDELAEPVSMPEPAPAAPPKRRAIRKPLPRHLPREVVVLEPAAADRICPVCGKEKQQRIGFETSEMLEWVPGHFKVIEIRRAKDACAECEGEISIAPPAPKPIDGGIPGPGLLADVIVRKYFDHAPLHRMRRIYARHGVDLAVSTLAGWVAAVATELEPLARLIRGHTLAAHDLKVDDTPLRVLDADKAGGSKRGHMWAYLGDRRWVTYDYTPDWSGAGPQAVLAGRKGWLQADAYAGFDRLFRGPAARLVEVGCFAHARRYYHKALAVDLRAAVGIAFVRRLYEVEWLADSRSCTPEERRALRDEYSRDILAKFKVWVDRMRGEAPPKSPLGQALTYTANQWDALCRFLQDGRLELDNNPVERELRSIAIGRVNWLFAGSDVGAERAAVIYTVLGTCRLHGVDPAAYLRDVLEKLAEGWPQRQIEELLPPHWAAARQSRPESTD